MAREGDPSRRRFLLGTGIAIGTAGLAGCGSPGGGEEDDDEEDGEEEDGEEEDGEEEEEQLQGPESQ